VKALSSTTEARVDPLYGRLFRREWHQMLSAGASRRYILKFARSSLNRRRRARHKRACSAPRRRRVVRRSLGAVAAGWLFEVSSPTLLVSTAMRSYLIATGVVFGLLALAHLLRTIAEWGRLASDPGFIVEGPGIGLVALAFSVWAWRLVRLNARGA
jgi:hypothetical protein